MWDDACETTTIEETIQLGLKKEAKSRYVRDCDYMKEIQRHGMKLAWRQKICQWMFETGKAFALSVDTVGCAVQYMDQFLCAESVDKIMMQLLSLVCIFSASKVHDSDPVTLVSPPV
uniref:Cyclin N-terminal domain-containing protein n=1 Tax=Globisporangium ultimum (strain ATCC 200006 / CBS 805.95 / DAOM BR144) TaxID=431595 RepID=K3WG57_GLOUD